MGDFCFYPKRGCRTNKFFAGPQPYFMLESYTETFFKIDAIMALMFMMVDTEMQHRKDSAY